MILSLRELGYEISYTYEPMDARVYYIVRCGETIVDMGEADEMNWSRVLKDICDECTSCENEK